MAGVAGWLTAQGIKTAISLVRMPKERAIRMLYVSGGMPSAHSATVVALATTIAFVDGVESSAFGIAAVLALVVMYDAMMVRRSSGRQGDVLVHLLEHTKSAIKVPRFAKGHEPIEVLVGAILGAIVGLVVYLITQS